MSVYDPILALANAIIVNACKDYFNDLRKLHEFEDADGKKLVKLKKINDAVEAAYNSDMSRETCFDMEWYKKQMHDAGNIVKEYYAVTQDKAELEQFFLSHWFVQLSRDSVDGERLINYLKEYELSGAKKFNSSYDNGRDEPF